MKGNGFLHSINPLQIKLAQVKICFRFICENLGKLKGHNRAVPEFKNILTDFS